MNKKKSVFQIASTVYTSAPSWRGRKELERKRNRRSILNIQEQNGKNTTAGQNRSRIEEIIEDRKRGQENTVREELQKQKEARTGRVKQSII